MTAEHKKLDNPAWHSLAETHRDFAIDFDDVKFYHPDYCAFGGFINIDKCLKSIDAYSFFTNNFYVIGERPLFSNNLNLGKNLVCNQMLLDHPVRIEINEQIIELQTTRHKSDLFALVNLVQPGYFKDKTTALGSYYGIYKDEVLMAVTGERMKMTTYTEVSAVVTHPGHTGKGYASQLIAFTTNKIFNESKLPYLHVSEANIQAIKLYEKIGFRTRRKISFWNLTGNRFINKMPGKTQ